MTHPGSGNPIWANDRAGGTPILAERLNNIEALLDSLVLSAVVTPESYGAVGDGVTDDSSAINAALAANNFVQLGEKIYAISNRINVPSNTVMAGRGGLFKGNDTAPTQFKCLTSGAGITLAGGGSLITDFCVDGNSVSTNGILVGATAAPWYAYSSMQRISVKDAGDNYRLYGTQNGLMQNCNSIRGTRGLVIDYAFGGWLFDRVEVDSPSSHGLVMLNTPASTLFPNTFMQCIFERRTTDGPIVLITAANQTHFTHCTFSTQQVTATTPLIVNNSNGTQEFDSPEMTIQANQAAIQTKGVGFGTNPTSKVFGAPKMSGYGASAAYFFDNDANGFATLDGWVTNSLTGAARVNTATTPDGNVARYLTTSEISIRTNTTDGVDSSVKRGDSQAMYKRDTAGRMDWGPGGATVTDTTLNRTAAGALTTTGTHLATTKLSAPVVVPSAYNLVNTGYNVVASDSLIVSTGASVSISLLSPASASVGQQFVIVNTNASPLLILAGGSNISGAVSDSLGQYEVGVYVSDGTNYWNLNRGSIQSVDVQVFGTAGAGTWTKPAHGKQTIARVWGAGGGGGSGAREPAGTLATGGGAGGGGGFTERDYVTSDLASTVAVTVGTHGTGGAAVTANGTVGNPGTSGTASSFGVSTALGCVANGGLLGAAGTAAGAAAGGAGNSGWNALGTAGGGSNATGAAGVAGTSAFVGAPGGGGGGGLATTHVSTTGGAGGAAGGNVLAGGAAGTAGGGAGGAGVSVPGAINVNPGTGGGGGGSNIGGAGGAGGAGGPAAGGGGGGASEDGSNSGKGGDGGDGLVVVTTYF